MANYLDEEGLRHLWSKIKLISQSPTGNLLLIKCTQTDYNALQIKDPNTVYFVIGDSGVKMYLGDIELKSGDGIPSGMTYMYSGNSTATQAIVGIATEITEEI